MAPAELVIRSELPVDLRRTLGPLRYGGRWDPCVRVTADGVWRAARFPSGPATMRLRSVAADRVAVRAWGPGADEALEAAPDLIGAEDDDGGLGACASPTVRRLARRLPGIRLGRTGNPMEALVPTVIHQKVQTRAAATSYCAMVRAARSSAPDPGIPAAPRLLLPPTAEWLIAQPSWAWHRWGIEAKRALTIVTAATYAARIGATVELAPAEALARLRVVPGVGAWTAAKVAAVAFGDPDAVSVGDYWLCHIVCHALTGQARGTDERMLELLEVWAGQRGRVCRLLTAGGPALPRFGPRLALQDITKI